ncbi:acyl-CoA thioesterase [Azotosporobacter soli]|uniref:acyl-CoA thioesterase n=1 Tax=Azotosporobacter soli TaxID=3055040 RepID=UPI003D16204C
MMVSVTDKVRFVETDMMGVVHHSNYFRWFEMARVAFLAKAGLTLGDFLTAGFLFPIGEVSCSYKAPARFDDAIRIEATLEEFSRVKMAFSYRVVRSADEVLLAEGRTRNVFTDQSGKICRLPDEYYLPLAALKEKERQEAGHDGR